MPRLGWCVRRLVHIMTMETMLKELIGSLYHFDPLDFVASPFTVVSSNVTTTAKRKTKMVPKETGDEENEEPEGVFTATCSVI